MDKIDRDSIVPSKYEEKKLSEYKNTLHCFRGTNKTLSKIGNSIVLSKLK